MAQIQISVAISTKHGSEFCCDLFRETLLSIHIETLIPSGDGTIVYDKSLLQFRGTPADLQLLADRIVAAVYPDKCQPDTDAQIDAEHEDTRRTRSRYSPAEHEDSAYAPGAGDQEVFRG